MLHSPLTPVLLKLTYISRLSLLSLCALPLISQSPRANTVLEMNSALRTQRWEGNRLGLRRMVEARADLLEQAIRAGDRPLSRFLLPADDAQRIRALVPDAASSIETVAEWEGELQGIVADDFQHGKSHTGWRLQTANETFELFFDDPTAPKTIAGGSRVHIEGISVHKVIAAGNILAQTQAPVACRTTGPQNIAYLIATMPSALTFPTGFNPSFFQQTAFGTSRFTLNHYWQESSYGLASATGQVFGPFALPQDYSCSQSNQLQTAILQAASASVDFTQYSRIAVIFPVAACYFGGLGTIGCQTLPNRTQVASFAYTRFWRNHSGWVEQNGGRCGI